MDSLPPEIKALKRIKELLDKLMSDRATPVEIRSNALYECIIKDNHLRKIFPVQRTFNQFLRQQHNNSILKQLLPNYRVDTSDRLHYRWYFFRETHKAGLGKGIETSDSKLAYKANELKVVSSNGQKFRSSQENDIYERLLTCDYLSIDLEFPISKHGEKRYATLIEIKRYDLEEKADIADVYLWLILEKPSGNIQKLTFRSMDSSGEVQERYFDQGYLKFNNQNGTYIEKFNSGQHQLENKTGKALPTEISDALTNYLKA